MTSDRAAIALLAAYALQSSATSDEAEALLYALHNRGRSAAELAHELESITVRVPAPNDHAWIRALLAADRAFSSGPFDPDPTLGATVWLQPSDPVPAGMLVTTRIGALRFVRTHVDL